MENVVSYLSQTNVPGTSPCEIINVRELPPPHPFKNPLEKLTEINDSIVLVQVNDRRPQHLYPKLDDRGYEYETFEDDDKVVTVIWKE